MIAHVLHDIREPDEARADLESARSLACALDIPFATASVNCVGRGGNVEAIARRERYAALTALAREQTCSFVATAHHADDQLETLLMRLIRGAGPRGLAGIAPRRHLAPGVVLVRPMLDIDRAAAETICAGAGVVWRVDATNADRSRLRAALRHNVLPALRLFAPGVAVSAGRVANVQRMVARDLHRQAAALLSRCAAPESGARFDREMLAEATVPVLDLALRQIIARTGGTPDAVSSRTLARLIGAIRDGSNERRRYQFPGAIVELGIGAIVVHRVGDQSD